VSQSITVDMSRFSGPVRAQWFDPTSGAYAPAHTGSTIPNAGSRLFTAPGLNAAGDSDWALRFDADFVAPFVSSSRFQFQARQAVDITFSEDLYTTLDDAAILITNLTTGLDLPASSFTTYYDRQNRTWSVLFKSAIPDGDYRLTLPGGSLRDGAGNAMLSHTFDFFTLAGDANRDRRVDFHDLLLLARNYNQSGRTFSEGNFDYSTDGLVNFSDFLILARNYNVTLTQALSAVTSPLPIQTTSGITAGIFRQQSLEGSVSRASVSAISSSGQIRQTSRANSLDLIA
jgi:hypothetical protein